MSSEAIKKHENLIRDETRYDDYKATRATLSECFVKSPEMDIMLFDLPRLGRM